LSPGCVFASFLGEPFLPFFIFKAVPLTRFVSSRTAGLTFFWESYFFSLWYSILRFDENFAFFSSLADLFSPFLSTAWEGPIPSSQGL